jgi:hypothetical protein
VQFISSELGAGSLQSGFNIHQKLVTLINKTEIILRKSYFVVAQPGVEDAPSIPAPELVRPARVESCTQNINHKLPNDNNPQTKTKLKKPTAKVFVLVGSDAIVAVVLPTSQYTHKQSTPPPKKGKIEYYEPIAGPQPGDALPVGARELSAVAGRHVRQVAHLPVVHQLVASVALALGLQKLLSYNNHPHLHH